MDAGRNILNVQKRGTWNEVQVQLAAASQLFIPYNPNRVALVIQNVSGSLLTLSRNDPVVGNIGIRMASTAAPLILTLHDHGAIVHGPFYAITGGAGTAVFWESQNTEV